MDTMMRGFSLLEVLIALAIVATTLIAVTLVTLGIPGVLEGTHLHAGGARLAASSFLREMARGSEGFPFIVSTSSSSDGYDIGLRITSIGDGAAREIASTASWMSSWGLARSVEVTGFATDYKNASDYPCSPFLFSIWEKPNVQQYTEAILPPIAALASSRQFIITTASSTRGFLDASLFVFDIHAGQPELTGSFDLGTSTKTGYVAVTASSEYLYALSAHECAQTSTCASLDIFKLSDSPLVRLTSLPMTRGRSITYRDNRLYVGLRTTSAGPELLVFDVMQPTQPVQIGSAEIGDTVNDIVTDGATTYLATADNSAAGNKAVMAFDVSSPHEGMTARSSTRQPGAGISQHLSLSGSTLYLGRSSPLNSKELYALEKDTLSRVLSAHDMDSSVAGLIIRGTRAFVLTRTRLEQRDATAPESLESVTEPILLPNGTSGTALICAGSRLYVAANTASEGKLITLSGL